MTPDEQTRCEAIIGLVLALIQHAGEDVTMEALMWLRDAKPEWYAVACELVESLGEGIEDARKPGGGAP